jgi:hypothetical protein
MILVELRLLLVQTSDPATIQTVPSCRYLEIASQDVKAMTALKVNLRSQPMTQRFLSSFSVELCLEDNNEG